jgi:hypothetical protein
MAHFERNARYEDEMRSRDAKARYEGEMRRRDARFGGEMRDARARYEGEMRNDTNKASYISHILAWVNQSVN